MISRKVAAKDFQLGFEMDEMFEETKNGKHAAR